MVNDIDQKLIILNLRFVSWIFAFGSYFQLLTSQLLSFRKETNQYRVYPIWS